MDNIAIPPKARQAVWEAFVEAAMNLNLSTEECLHAASLAMLKAWPGAQDSGLTMGKHSTRIYILPLPTENTDDNG